MATSSSIRFPRAPSVPFSGRTLRVVGYENVFGGLKPEKVRDSRACYERAFVGIEDDVVVAAHPRHFPVLPVNWQNARHRFRDGKNGADLALLEVLDDDHVLDRFETVVIASGDGIFVKPARRLRRARADRSRWDTMLAEMRGALQAVLAVDVFV